MSIFSGGCSLQPLKKAATAAGQDCALCGAAARDLVCAPCSARLPRADPGWFEDARGPLAFDDAAAAFDYRFPVDRLIHRFKFAGDLAVGRWLSLRLAETLAGRTADLVVVPPLTPASLRARGFNQALEVAKIVGDTLGVGVAVTGLVKVRDTPPQPALGAARRRRNLCAAFRCDLALAGEHVAIVDDVITTGATADAVAHALRDAGAGRVSAWAVARTPR